MPQPDTAEPEPYALLPGWSSVPGSAIDACVVLALVLWRERSGAAEGIHSATLAFNLASFRQWWTEISR